MNILMAVVEGNILETEMQWSHKPAACVVLASGGYPLKYEKGKRIEGLKEASKMPGITIFQAGTKFKDDKFYTNGGRVLRVCASEESLSETMKKIFRAIDVIYFEAMHFRRDIGTEKEV